MIPYVSLAPAIAEIRGDIDAAIKRVLDRGIFLGGEETAAFEEEWAAYCGAKYCVACASGTDALMLAAKSNFRATHTVPANTLPFTMRGLLRTGCRVDASDVDDRGCPILNDCVQVLLYGRFREMNQGYDRIVDACQAHGWKNDAPFALNCWSFYPTKNLGCLGDGGAVTMSSISDYQIIREYAAIHPSRMSELNAAVLRTKLQHLDRWNAMRHVIAEVYYNELPDWAEPACRPGEPTNHHIFAVLVDGRDELEQHLLKNGVGVKVHYREPLAELPGARRWCDRTLSLPCWPGLAPQEVQTVCDTIKVIR